MAQLVSRKNRRLARPRKDDGIAVVEMAVMLPFFVLLIACTLFIGRALLYYQIACSASHDAARYLSSVSIQEIRNPSKIEMHVNLAKAIVTEEMGSAMTSGPYPPVITILCGGITCSGFSTPLSVSVAIQMLMFDDVLPMFTTDIKGGAPITITASAIMPYVGN